MNSALIKKSLAHLRREPKLAQVIDSIKEKPKFDNDREPFQALCSAIIYQQLSGKAAATIHGRFLKLYKKPAGPKNHPSPKQVAATSAEKFRTAGVSAQKAGYLQDLARKFLDGTIDPSNFHEMTDEAIRAHLVAVKGIGRWTADMFLMFTLHRPDVLPTGDLGIQKGMQKLFNLKKLPDAARMEKLALAWQPYRTVACWYLWRMQDVPKEKK